MTEIIKSVKIDENIQRTVKTQMARPNEFIRVGHSRLIIKLICFLSRVILQTHYILHLVACQIKIELENQIQVL